MTLKKETKRSSKKVAKLNHKATNCIDESANVLQQENLAKECKQEAGAQSTKLLIALCKILDTWEVSAKSLEILLISIKRRNCQESYNLRY